MVGIFYVGRRGLSRIRVLCQERLLSCSESPGMSARPQAGYTPLKIRPLIVYNETMILLSCLMGILPTWKEVDRWPIGTFQKLVVDRDRRIALILARRDVVIVDLHDPPRLTRLAQIPFPHSLQDAVYDPGRKILFVLHQDAGFSTVDLTDPRHPRRLATIPGWGKGARILLYQDTLLLILETESWIHVWNVSNPSLPFHRKSHWDLTRSPPALIWKGKLLTGSHADSILLIWDLDRFLRHTDWRVPYRPQQTILPSPHPADIQGLGSFHIDLAGAGRSPRFFLRSDTLVVFYTAQGMYHGLPVSDIYFHCAVRYRIAYRRSHLETLVVSCEAPGPGLAYHGSFIVAPSVGFTSGGAYLWQERDNGKSFTEKIWNKTPVDADSMDPTAVLLLSRTTLALRRLPEYRERLPEGEFPDFSPATLEQVQTFSMGGVAGDLYIVAVQGISREVRIVGVKRIPFTSLRRFRYTRAESSVCSVPRDTLWSADRKQVHTPYGSVPLHGVSHLVPFTRDFVVFQNRHSYGTLGVLQAFHWTGRQWIRTLYRTLSVYPLPNGLFRVNDRCVLLTAQGIHLYCMEIP